MPKTQTLAKKQEIVKQISKLLGESGLIVFSDPTKLNANETRALRLQLSKLGAKFQLVKKTLFKLALKEAGFGEIKEEKMFGSSVAVLALPEITVEAVKLLFNTKKLSKDRLLVFGGMMGKDILDPNQINSLAKLPERQILLGQLVGTLASPIRGFAFVLQANIQKLLMVLGRIKASA
ncbi:50S ribosomal protein L10 [Candidatus Parcubacteria bacterium]|nr:MAG: 50S ribosomal protein L10 [Candidatus Parcubacteria bacterium]